MIFIDPSFAATLAKAFSISHLSTTDPEKKILDAWKKLPEGDKTKRIVEMLLLSGGEEETGGERI